MNLKVVFTGMIFLLASISISGMKLEKKVNRSAFTSNWYRTNYSLSSYQEVFDAIFSQTNTQSSAVNSTYTASGAFWQKVYGEASNTPPWSSAFTPLHNGNQSITDTNRTVTIAAGQTFERRLYRGRQTGVEEWTEEDIDLEIIIFWNPRNRFWEVDGILLDWWNP